MGGRLKEARLHDTITKLAHELADAHALMTTQQKKRAVGQHVFNAKEIAYTLLHKMDAARARRPSTLKR